MVKATQVCVRDGLTALDAAVVCVQGMIDPASALRQGMIYADGASHWTPSDVYEAVAERMEPARRIIAADDLRTSRWLATVSYRATQTA